MSGNVIPEGYKTTKLGVIPEDWRLVSLADIITPVIRGVNKPKSGYWRLGLRSHGKGTFHTFIEDPSKVDMDTLFVVKNNDLIVNITFAWEHAIAVATIRDEGKLVSHRFPTYVFNDSACRSYYKYYILQPGFKFLLENISPGGAGRNRVMSKKDFLKLPVIKPPLKEQKKISEILIAWDEAINKQLQLIKQKENFKKGLIYKLFSGVLRFPAFKDSWHFVKLSELLDYEQPGKYIVSNTDYKDEYPIPVLTAGKSFILGYTNEQFGVYNKDLPVVIFDDFTTGVQFVDFPFKVKSSAIKILKPKSKLIDLKLVFELIKMINFAANDHKRYWISEYQEFEVKLPSIEEQQKISDLLTVIDNEIKLLTAELTQFNLQRQGLIQKLLTGQVRVKI
jgi:type I restriction enzyme S subunit